MAIRKLGLTRDQLASFLQDFEQIKQFEKLFGEVDDISNVQLEAVNIAAANAEATANEALAELRRIANALEFLANAPSQQYNNSVATDYVDLIQPVPVPADKPGRVYWNVDDGTMDISQYGGSLLQVGQELQYYAKNTSGAPIAIGTPVMFTGTVGSSGKLTFGLAVADGSVPADYMMGVAAQTIANNGFGYIISFGLLRGFNTTGTPYGETWADGDLLYFDPATPGTWTKFQPAAPNIAEPVAVVVNAASAGSGSIFIRMKISERLNTLQDVYINGTGTPLAGQTLLYDATQARWENHHLTAGTGISIVNGDGSVTISNTAPDQTVSLTGAGTTTISGTYPNFTITSNDQFTGTVTSVGGTGTVNGLTLTGTVTSSGNLTLGGTLSGVSLTTQVSGTLPVGNGGTGTATAFTSGSVVFAGGSGVYSQDNANLFWDDSNNRLGIGTTTPGFPLDVNGETRASKFTSSAGAQSLASSTPLTILTLTGTAPRIYLVSIALDAAGAGDTSVALVVAGNNGSGGPDLSVTDLKTTTQSDITVSGGDIIVQQNSGITLNITWSITRIM
jgi:hypothetical protein